MAQDGYADAYGYPYDAGAGLHGYMGDIVPLDETSVPSYTMSGEAENGTARFHSGTYGTNHQPHLHTPPLVRYCPPYWIPYTQSNDLPSLPTLTTPMVTVRLVPVNPAIMAEGPQIFLGLPTSLVAGSLAVPIHTSFAAGELPPDMQVYPVERYGDAFLPPSVGPEQETDFHWMPNNSDIFPIEEEGPPIVTVGLGAWKCMVCGLVLRRKQRAVVHFWNKHENMRLRCSGRCGVMGCDKSYASQHGFEVHLNPVMVRCDSCGKSLLKKNILRHQEGHCHRVNHNQGMNV